MRQTFEALRQKIDQRAHDGQTSFKLEEGRTLTLVVLHGTVLVNDAEKAHTAELVILDHEGSEIVLQAETDASVLLLSGQPIDEPVVGYGPFVMNSREEIQQAYRDFSSGLVWPDVTVRQMSPCASHATKR